MEDQMKILEEKTIDFKRDKKRDSIVFWKNYLMKSWPFYIVAVIGSAFVFGIYLRNKNITSLYIAIIYLIAIIAFFIIEGMIRNFRYLSVLQKDARGVLLSIYSDRIRVFKKDNGITHMHDFPYEAMKDIIYDAKNECIVFSMEKGPVFSIDKEDVKQETFQFLISLSTNEKK